MCRQPPVGTADAEYYAALRQRTIVPNRDTVTGRVALEGRVVLTALDMAIANSRLVAFDGERVTFKWKDYRVKADNRYKLMTLDVDEFIRRFLIHVLPDGFHRIRHYGLFANGGRAENIARARRLLNVPAPQQAASDADSTGDGEPQALWHPCPCCGGLGS